MKKNQLPGFGIGEGSNGAPAGELAVERANSNWNLARIMRQKTEQSSELAGRGESAEAGSDVEILAVNSDNENPAWNNCLVEEILTRANLRQALQRVKSNKGAPGMDGMTVTELREYLKSDWVSIKEHLLSSTYKPQPVNRPQNHIFLGFSFSKGNRRKLAQKAIRRFKNRVRYLTSRTGGRSLMQVVAQLKRFLQDWHQYFGIAQLKKDFDLLNSWIRHKLRCMLWKQWGNSKEAIPGAETPRSQTIYSMGNHEEWSWRLSRSLGVMQALSCAFSAALGIPELTTTSVLNSRRTAV